MNGPIEVTEQDKETIASWYAEAKEIKNADELSSFVEMLTTDYKHDYGTIVEACAAAAIAAMATVDKSEQGYLTGFQAGCVAWRFFEHVLHLEGPAKLLRFEEMLYPQNASIFEKTIPESGFKLLQEMAMKNLASSKLSPNVQAHMESIVDGVVPFGYTIKD